ncbi:MAG: hypothetical protein JO222_10865, partial [Frankiales bacterium]|nr:hypothetical protein [Frankiales bacterium]
CRDERLLTKLDNHHDVADDEQGAPVWSCALRAPTWTQAWPAFRALG